MPGTVARSMTQAVTSKKFYRTNQSDKWIAGVCGGLARYFNIDPLLVRVLWIVLTLVTAVVPCLIAYLVLALAAPSET